MELTPVQILVIGLIATVLTQGIKLLKLELSKQVITIVVFVISVILAYLWNPVAVPSISDPAEFATWLVQTAGVLVGWATVIYNVLLANVLDNLTKRLKAKLYS